MFPAQTEPKVGAVYGVPDKTSFDGVARSLGEAVKGESFRSSVTDNGLERVP